jgi:hypothetical protein
VAAQGRRQGEGRRVSFEDATFRLGKAVGRAEVVLGELKEAREELRQLRAQLAELRRERVRDLAPDRARYVVRR